MNNKAEMGDRKRRIEQKIVEGIDGRKAIGHLVDMGYREPGDPCLPGDVHLRPALKVGASGTWGRKSVR